MLRSLDQMHYDEYHIVGGNLSVRDISTYTPINVMSSPFPNWTILVYFSVLGKCPSALAAQVSKFRGGCYTEEVLE